MVKEYIEVVEKDSRERERERAEEKRRNRKPRMSDLSITAFEFTACMKDCHKKTLLVHKRHCTFI